MKRHSFFSSWSGGKDSSLALFKEMEKGGAAKLLLSIFEEGKEKSRAHGLRREIIRMQSESLGIPFEIVRSGWGQYGEVFKKVLEDAESKGLDCGVFGDIDLVAHRDWIEQRTSLTNIEPHFPLWGMSREEVVIEFIERGFKAVIVSCRKEALDRSFLGRTLDFGLVEELKSKGVDVAGENGEYHTLVLDGPIFNSPLDIRLGEVSEDERQHYIEVKL